MENIKALLKSDGPLKWMFYGDSITHGALHTFGQRDYSELFTERIRFELGRSQDVVLKTAISGNTTESLLATFDWRVRQFEPHVVFLMIGMNDCSNNKVPLENFESNLNELTDKIGEWGGRVVMQTTCPILPNTSQDREPHLPDYMDAIRKVSADRGLPLVDHTKYWEENRAKFYYWMSDAFHPNELGHRAFAALVYRALDIWDDSSACCRLFIP